MAVLNFLYEKFNILFYEIKSILTKKTRSSATDDPKSTTSAQNIFRDRTTERLPRQISDNNSIHESLFESQPAWIIESPIQSSPGSPNTTSNKCFHSETQIASEHLVTNFPTTLLHHVTDRFKNQIKFNNTFGMNSFDHDFQSIHDLCGYILYKLKQHLIRRNLDKLSPEVIQKVLEETGIDLCNLTTEDLIELKTVCIKSKEKFITITKPFIFVIEDKLISTSKSYLNNTFHSINNKLQEKLIEVNNNNPGRFHLNPKEIAAIFETENIDFNSLSLLSLEKLNNLYQWNNVDHRILKSLLNSKISILRKEKIKLLVNQIILDPVKQDINIEYLLVQIFTRITNEDSPENIRLIFQEIFHKLSSYRNLYSINVNFTPSVWLELFIKFNDLIPGSNNNLEYIIEFQQYLTSIDKAKSIDKNTAPTKHLDYWNKSISEGCIGDCLENNLVAAGVIYFMNSFFLHKHPIEGINSTPLIYTQELIERKLTNQNGKFKYNPHFQLQLKQILQHNPLPSVRTNHENKGKNTTEMTNIEKIQLLVL